MGQSRMRIANWWYSRKEYPVAVKCYKKALQFYNNIPTNQVRTGSSTATYLHTYHAPCQKLPPVLRSRAYLVGSGFLTIPQLRLQLLAPVVLVLEPRKLH